MNKSGKLLSLAVLVAASTAALAQADIKDLKVADPTTAAYLIDSRNIIVRDPYGLCWRTGSWTPALAAATRLVGSEFPAGCACDKEVMPAELCTPKPPPVAAVAPPPPPPPAPAPRPAPPAPVSEKVTFSADAFFDFDKSILKPEGKASIDGLVAKLGTINLEVIIAVGHTDSIGTDAYNQKLSVRRAEAVKAYMIGKGVEANRVYTEGRGESQPKAPNTLNGKDNPAGRAQNRRVEIEVVGTTRTPAANR